MLFCSYYRYNYEGKYLDAQELKDFLEIEQSVSMGLFAHVTTV